MPLPNGVDPLGEIGHSCPSAALMGNRGILHNQPKGPAVKPWAHKAWVACRLAFGNFQRGERIDGKLILMAKTDEYSELFFLDEATAFSAGHRPCGTCRKHDYKQFKRYWCEAKLSNTVEFSPKAVDAMLHEERWSSQRRSKKTDFSKLGELPSGAMFLLESSPMLAWKGRFWHWSDTGYIEATRKPSPLSKVEVLTSSSLLAVLRVGYPLQVHPSASFS